MKFPFRLALAAGIAVAVCVAMFACQQANAGNHGVVAFRNTPLRPFKGPVPTHNFQNADFFVAPHHHGFNSFHGVNAFRGYTVPFYSAPAAFSYSVPAPIVYAQPAPVVAYTQPAPVVSTYQSYSASSSYGNAPAAYSGPQAFSAGGVTYQLPDGRIVLPSGQVIEPR